MHVYILLALLVGYVAATGVVGWRFLRIYCHKDERNNFLNITIRLVIIMGYIQCMGMIIIVPAVAQVASFPKMKEHFNPNFMCKIIYAIFGIYVFIITPCLAVIYSHVGEVSHTDQYASEPNKRRIKHWGRYIRKICTHRTSAICKNVLLMWIVSITLSCCILFLTYLHFHKIRLSLNAHSCTQWYPYLEETMRKKLLSLNLKNIKMCQNVGNENIPIVFNLNFNDYVIMFVSLMGSIVLAVYVGVGLVSLPLGLLFSAVSRYRGGEATPAIKVTNADERREDIFKDQLIRINRKAEDLLQVTQEVELSREQTCKSNYIKSFLQNIQHKREKRILNYMVHRLVVDYEKSVYRYNNPTSVTSSYGFFLLGFFFLLANASIIVYLYLCILRGSAGQGKLTSGWLLHWDATQELLERKDSLPLSLLIYPLVASYFLVCAFSGFNYICHKVGLLLALERKNTYLDIILLNTCLLMFVSSGAALIILRLFPAYAKEPYAFAFFDLALKNLSIIGYLYTRNGLLHLILVVSVLTVLLFFVPEESDLFSVFMPATFRKILNQPGEADSGIVSDIELEGQLDVNIKRKTTVDKC
eukprot:XP_002261492.1 hypothetical protein, conserved in Plasmodium species [Plasmodium knowlesi strain H]